VLSLSAIVWRHIALYFIKKVRIEEKRDRELTKKTEEEENGMQENKSLIAGRGSRLYVLNEK